MDIRQVYAGTNKDRDLYFKNGANLKAAKKYLTLVFDETTKRATREEVEEAVKAARTTKYGIARVDMCNCVNYGNGVTIYGKRLRDCGTTTWGGDYLKIEGDYLVILENKEMVLRVKIDDIYEIKVYKTQKGKNAGKVNGIGINTVANGYEDVGGGGEAITDWKMGNKREFVTEEGVKIYNQLKKLKKADNGKKLPYNVVEYAWDNEITIHF